MPPSNHTVPPPLDNTPCLGSGKAHLGIDIVGYGLCGVLERRGDVIDGSRAQPEVIVSGASELLPSRAELS